MTIPHSISIVDDDLSVRESLEALFQSIGFKVRTFASAESFLVSNALDSTDCLVLDVRLAGMSGPELQRTLSAMQQQIPTVFITAHGDELLRSRVLAEGAAECLSKPCSEEDLLSAVEKAIEFGPK